MFSRIFTFSVVGIFIYASFAHAEMSSTNYQIRWDTFSSGGSDTSSSASYSLRDTTDPSVAGSSSSATYQISAGYRAGVFDQIITFDLFVQNTSTERSATNLTGNTVTTDTTGLAV